MALELNIIATYIPGNCNQFLTDDITGPNDPVTNPGGWGGPNPNVASVFEVTIAATWQNNILIPPTVYPAYTLMPTTQYPLPYSLGQEFILNPSMFGITDPTFADGIWIFLYTVSVYTTYTIVSDVNLNLYFTVGDTITNKTTGLVLGVVSYVDSTTLILTDITMNTVSSGQQITNGTVLGTVTLTPFTSATFGDPEEFSTTITMGNLCNSYCCLNNKLANMDFCCGECQQKAVDNLFWNYMCLKGAEAALGCLKNGQFLENLQCVTIFCNSQPCQPCTGNG